MNSKTNWQQFKFFCFAYTFLALLLAATDKAAAAIEIKDTNYSIPSDAYFVSPDGSSSSSGKSAASPTTVAKAISSAPAGATIVFRGGTYRNVNSIGILKKVTLQAYPHEKAWLKGSTVVTGWISEGNVWRKDGWNSSFPMDVASKYITSSYPMAGYRDMVYIGGVALKQVGSRSAVGAGTFYVDAAKNKLYIGNNPAGKTVEATSQSQAFSMYKGKVYNPAGVVIRGLGFAHYADQGLTVGASSVKLEDNTFAWNGVMGAYLRGENATDVIVRGNTFSYNGRKGVGGHHAHRMLLENNTISYNNVEHFTTDTDAAGAKVTEAEGLVWRNNLVEHNYSTGLWIDSSCVDATMVKNTSRYNDSIGVFFEASHRAIIAANIAYGNKYTGVMVSNASSTKVYNNTLVDNGGANLLLKDTPRNNTNKAEIARGITWISRNNVFKNNILSNTTGSSLFQATNCSTRERSSLMIADADYNAYYRKSSSQPGSAVTWSLGGSKCSVGYSSVNGFSSSTGFEDHALAIDNVSSNPFFVNEQAGNYQLKSGSSALNRGTSLPKDVADAIGVKSGVQVDLGAIQS